MLTELAVAGTGTSTNRAREREDARRRSIMRAPRTLLASSGMSDVLGLFESASITIDSRCVSIVSRCCMFLAYENGRPCDSGRAITEELGVRVSEPVINEKQHL